MTVLETNPSAPAPPPKKSLSSWRGCLFTPSDSKETPVDEYEEAQAESGAEAQTESGAFPVAGNSNTNFMTLMRICIVMRC
jgi:hypothetical protein